MVDSPRLMCLMPIVARLCPNVNRTNVVFVAVLPVL